MIEIKKTEIFEKWFRKIKDGKTRSIINMHIIRLSQEYNCDCKPIGKGLSELRIHYGQGFRIYYKKKNNQIIILLCAGDKSTQEKDIQNAYKIAMEV
ncbi:type II toxin-antitoxin system RelE/ParE family toxin [Treponema denticola]|uniref:type II toxin-antitoxin system RelE/ParE family toxin n=1 Tax=Treponema denticola TaxID=158 RepID=UPI0020A43614|nr:type II toxin-antitoxin system RelE/ParE family toxin [Treponema denticola]UTC82949.1 type II toxin-antitoxin system RelE/ParE family toxin [Treponema denticola]